MTWQGWTDENTEEAAKLWREGFSAAQIAKLLCAVSRNAVIGRLHRKGLTSGSRVVPNAPRLTKPPRAPVVRTTARSVYRAPSGPARDPRPFQPIAAPVDAPEPLNVTLMDLGAHQCRWPVSGEGADMRFCGVTVVCGSYCSAHDKRAYDKAATAQKRKEAASLYRMMVRAA